MVKEKTLAGTIGIIGAGNMGSAIVGGLNAKYPDASIWVLDHKKENCQRIEAKWPVHTTLDAKILAEHCTVILLAVKPQTIKTVLDDIKPYVSEETLFISVAAGITTQQITKALAKSCPVIRAMPNLPALIGKGISGLYAATSQPEHKQQAQVLLGAIGETIWLEDESLMDVITALSGSGPGYLFYFLESLVNAGVQLGLTSDQAFKLVSATAFGSCQMLGNNADLKNLRQQVTSKDGTTEAAIQYLEAQHWPQIISTAVIKAKERGQALSQQMD